MTTGKLASKYCAATSVVLAVNPETGEIVNKAAGEGKVDIDIHSTCTAHSASHPGYVVQKPKPKQPVDSEVPIGADYPSESTNETTTPEAPAETTPPQEPVAEPEPPTAPVTEPEPPPSVPDVTEPIGAE